MSIYDRISPVLIDSTRVLINRALSFRTTPRPDSADCPPGNQGQRSDSCGERQPSPPATLRIRWCLLAETGRFGIKRKYGSIDPEFGQGMQFRYLRRSLLGNELEAQPYVLDNGEIHDADPNAVAAVPKGNRRQLSIARADSPYDNRRRRAFDLERPIPRR